MPLGMDDWRSEILDRLQKYSAYKSESGEGYVSVRPGNADSFDVSIQNMGDTYTVSFDGWHEEFDDLPTALNCFAFGLSDQCRLKVTVRGAMDCVWTVQSLENDGWVDGSTTGMIMIPFWRPKRVEFRHSVLMLKE